MSIFTRAFQTLDGVFKGRFLGGASGADGPAIPLHGLAHDPDTPVDTDHPFPVRDVDRAALLAILGEVAANPAANTLLARLKDIATGVSGLAGFLDGVEGLQGTTNTLLTGLNGYVDGLETLATTLNGYVDGLEGKEDALKASIDALFAAIRPPQNHFLVAPGTGALANATRRIIAGAAGTLTVEANGVSASYPVQAGQIIDIVAQKITAAPAGTVGQY